MIFFWFLLLPFSLFGNTSWESPAVTQFSAKVTISAEKITLKDKLTIDLTVTYPKDYTLDPNTIRSHLLKQTGYEETPFKLTSENVEPPISAGRDKVQQRFTYTLDPLLSGDHYLSFFDLPFVKQDQKFYLYTYIFPVTVSEGGQEKIAVMNAPLMNFDLTLPVELSPANRRKFLENPAATQQQIARNKALIQEKSIPWLLVLGLVLSGAFLALCLKREVKPETEAEKQQKIRTLKEESLDEIRDAPKSDPEAFFVELSDVLRRYIEKKFGINAPSQTTEEFLRSIHQRKMFNPSEQQSLEDFLTQADKVKFAKYIPSDAEKDDSLTAVKRFIVST